MWTYIRSSKNATEHQRKETGGMEIEAMGMKASKCTCGKFAAAKSRMTERLRREVEMQSVAGRATVFRRIWRKK